MYLVIGYGNPLRGDDGVAWRAVEAVRVDGVERLVVQQLTPELAEAVSRADGVVLVDARDGAPPGEVRVEPVGAPDASAASSHGLSPGLLLEYARRLWGRAPPAVVVTVGAESFALGDRLSPVVRRALPAVAARIESQIAAWMGGGRKDP